jgi:hypothetical protein
MAVPFFVMFAGQYRVGAVLWVKSFMTLASRRDP